LFEKMRILCNGNLKGCFEFDENWKLLLAGHDERRKKIPHLWIEEVLISREV
jgi:hypothetical protein